MNLKSKFLEIDLNRKSHEMPSIREGLSRSFGRSSFLFRFFFGIKKAGTESPIRTDSYRGYGGSRPNKNTMRFGMQMFLFISMVVLVTSCDKKRVFDDYKSVGTAWEKDSILAFSFKQEDTTKLYNLFVNLRANQAYQFNNLYLIVAMERPGGLVKIDTLQYQMTNPDGSLLGDGFSDIKESKLFYKENLRFDTIGDYRVKIQQAMRQTGKIEGIKALEGITEVGFRIETID